MIVKVEQLKNMTFDNEWLTPDEEAYIKGCFKKDNRVFKVLGIVLIVVTVAILCAFAALLSGVAGEWKDSSGIIAIIVMATICFAMSFLCFVAGYKRQKKIELCIDTHNYSVKNTAITRVRDANAGYISTYSCECYGIPGTWGIFDRKRAKTAKPGQFVKFVVLWNVQRLQSVFILIR